MGPEQQKTFDDLKQYLQHLPMLSSLEQGQPLILYDSATHSIVSGALFVEKKVAHKGATTKQQYLVYFVSEVFVTPRVSNPHDYVNHIFKRPQVLMNF
jgi:hypothetical protein